MTDFEARLRRAGEQLDAAAASAVPRRAAPARCQAARVFRPLAGVALGLAVIAGTLIWWSHQVPGPTSVVTSSGTSLSTDRYVTVRVSIEGASAEDPMRLGLGGIRTWTLPAGSIIQLPVTVDSMVQPSDRVTASEWQVLEGHLTDAGVGNVHAPCITSHLISTATFPVYEGPTGGPPAVPLYIDLKRIQPGTLLLGTELQLRHADGTGDVVSQPVRLRLDVSKARTLADHETVTTSTSMATHIGDAAPPCVSPSGPEVEQLLRQQEELSQIIAERERQAP